MARAARLLEEAEQIARALPLDEQAMAPEDRAAAIPGPPPPPASSSARARGLDDEYDRALALAVQRARALVHVATVAARSDPAHAAQLLDDALHPSWNERIAGTAGYHHILEALVWHSASEFGMLLARIDPSPAKRLVADIEKIPPVIRALHHREFLDDVAPFITKVAEVVADVDVASEDLRSLSEEGHHRGRQRRRRLDRRAARDLPAHARRAGNGRRLGRGRCCARLFGGSAAAVHHRACNRCRNRPLPVVGAQRFCAFARLVWDSGPVAAGQATLQRPQTLAGERTRRGRTPSARNSNRRPIRSRRREARHVPA